MKKNDKKVISLQNYPIIKYVVETVQMFAEFKVKERENMDETRDDAKEESLHTSHPVG